MFANSKNVLKYIFGNGTFSQLEELIESQKSSDSNTAIIFVDHYFKNKDLISKLSKDPSNKIFWIDSSTEISTDLIDNLACEAKGISLLPCCVVGIGGGTVLDTAKAVSNLLTNEGQAKDYQGWDLIKNKGVYKIGVPTLSGTGAEASRTCVMMNHEKNLKLGMNSEHTIFDQLVLDPALSQTVPRDQYFYTGLDTYIHCIESLNGEHRHSIADSFSYEALRLAREVFLGKEDMMSDKNREKIMVASYLGGCAIANSYVGVVHPFSAGLSVVLGIHHCEANCIAMNVLDEFYPNEVKEFRAMLDRQQVNLRRGLCSSLTDEQYEKLYLSTVIHEIPLKNALGEDFKSILSRDKVISLFRKM